ncbi:MAG: hypothetical protein IPN34_04795 [Planctomycetes bacterium]|nr:hypothetical protein [Planctomycetota bacterium]
MTRHHFAGPAVCWGREALEGLRQVAGGRWLLWTDLAEDDERLVKVRSILATDPVALCTVQQDEMRMSGGTDRCASALNIALGDRDLCDVVDTYLGNFETAAPLVWSRTRLQVLSRGWGADKVVFDPEMFVGDDVRIDPSTLLQALIVIVDEVLRPTPSPTGLALASHAWRGLWDLRRWLSSTPAQHVAAEIFLDVVVLTSLAREVVESESDAAPIELWEDLLEDGQDLMAARSLGAFLRQRMEEPAALERLERFALGVGFAGPAGFVIGVGECCDQIARWLASEGRGRDVARALPIAARSTFDCGGELGAEAWQRLLGARA